MPLVSTPDAINIANASAGAITVSVAGFTPGVPVTAAFDLTTILSASPASVTPSTGTIVFTISPVAAGGGTGTLTITQGAQVLKVVGAVGAPIVAGNSLSASPATIALNDVFSDPVAVNFTCTTASPTISVTNSVTPKPVTYTPQTFTTQTGVITFTASLLAGGTDRVVINDGPRQFAIPVILGVTTTTLKANPTSASFTSTANPPVIINVKQATGSNTVTATFVSGGVATVSPASFTGANGAFTITPTSMAGGTDTLVLTDGTTTINIPVTLAITPGVITASPPFLNFTNALATSQSVALVRTGGASTPIAATFATGGIATVSPLSIPGPTGVFTVTPVSLVGGSDVLTFGDGTESVAVPISVGPTPQLPGQLHASPSVITIPTVSSGPVSVAVMTTNPLATPITATLQDGTFVTVSPPSMNAFSGVFTVTPTNPAGGDDVLVIHAGPDTLYIPISLGASSLPTNPKGKTLAQAIEYIRIISDAPTAPSDARIGILMNEALNQVGDALDAVLNSVSLPVVGGTSTMTLPPDILDIIKIGYSQGLPSVSGSIPYELVELAPGAFIDFNAGVSGSFGYVPSGPVLYFTRLQDSFGRIRLQFSPLPPTGFLNLTYHPRVSLFDPANSASTINLDSSYFELAALLTAGKICMSQRDKVRADGFLQQYAGLLQQKLISSGRRNNARTSVVRDVTSSGYSGLPNWYPQ